MNPQDDIYGKTHPEGLMTVRDIAKKRLCCSLAHVYALIESGELACYKIGLKTQGGIRVSEQQLLDYLSRKEKNRAASVPPPTKHISL